VQGPVLVKVREQRARVVLVLELELQAGVGIPEPGAVLVLLHVPDPIVAAGRQPPFNPVPSCIWRCFYQRYLQPDVAQLDGLAGADGHLEPGEAVELQPAAHVHCDRTGLAVSVPFNESPFLPGELAYALAPLQALPGGILDDQFKRVARSDLGCSWMCVTSGV